MGANSKMPQAYSKTDLNLLVLVRTRANSVVAVAGAIGFAVVTFVAIFVVNWPGGGYSESIAKNHVAPPNLPVALTGTLIGLIGVVCLICLLAYLSKRLRNPRPRSHLCPKSSGPSASLGPRRSQSGGDW